MEDHLKNKDRLDLEWEGLCTYEADPSNTNIANDPANIRKNRYSDTVPCKYAKRSNISKILQELLQQHHALYVCQKVKISNILQESLQRPVSMPKSQTFVTYLQESLQRHCAL